MTSNINGFRISPSQRRMINLMNDHPVTAYTGQYEYMIQGDLNKKQLIEAIKKVFKTNTVLSTEFQKMQGLTYPLQFVNENNNPYIEIDEENNTEFFDDEVWKYDEVPLVRIRLLKQSENKHILKIYGHPLCMDHQIQLLLYKIFTTYGTDTDSIESEEPISYIEVSEWLNELEDLDHDESGWSYWESKSNHLKGAAQKLNFTNNNTKNNHEIDEINLNLNPETIEKVKAFTIKRDSSIEDFFLTCWFDALYKYTNSSEITVGNLLNGRSDEELMDTIGPLSRYIPVTQSLKDNMSFEQLFLNISRLVDENRDWSEGFNWEKLKNHKDIDFFPFGFDFSNFDDIEFEDLKATLNKAYFIFDRFDLRLSCINKNDDTKISIFYNPQAYGRQELEWFSRSLEILIKNAVDHGETSLSNLPLVDKVYGEDWIEVTNSNYRIEDSHVETSSIIELFEKQVISDPDKSALVFENEKLTYLELNKKANQLANQLLHKGVQREAKIGVYMERSTEAIISILGILKAGAAYVPLEPQHPEIRISNIVQDSGLELILTNEKAAKTFPNIDVEKVIVNDRNISGFSSENLNLTITKNQMVYVIYTSGSTGSPKGVLVENAQLLHYYNAFKEMVDLERNTSYAYISSLTTDIGNTILYSSLLSGGCLHILTQEIISNAANFSNYIKENSIDCYKITPYHLETLLRDSSINIFPEKTLIFGGESLDSRLINRIRSSSSCDIYNHYGPTETTIGAAIYKLNDDEMTTVPIGKPLKSSNIYILDNNLNPVPIGVSGEVYIGGHTVSRGYLNLPDLTASQFIPDPYTPGARLYKTGDLARHVSNFNIEFIGRKDNQKKIRGYRVELSEIEKTLEKFPLINKAIVRLEDDDLLAFVETTKQDKVINVNEMYGLLLDKLPEYMVPKRIIPVTEFPLLSNGKVDIKSLSRHSQDNREFVEAKTNTERAVKLIWEELLGIEEISITDNFFRIGGHSLIVPQLIANIKRSFDVEIPLRKIFDKPTIQNMSSFIEELILLEIENMSPNF